MKVPQILGQLEALGNETRRKHNAKSGAPANQFGVPLGDVRKVAKALQQNQKLALELWESGNVEAQLVATLLLKPTDLSADDLDRLTRSTTCSQVADWLNSYVVAQHADKEQLREKWMKSKERWTARAGWNLTASRIAKSADGLDLDALLARIEKELPKAAPEVQWTMNMALGNLGIHHAKFRARVLALGEKIGLYKDWPVSKGCTPPYVPTWVTAMVQRKP
ncbi:MAG: DNA alkylation repair protein [Planctomycetota bacterium]|nr:DNA alkylation repair protein [Planctomycetota bacterium]